MAGGDFNARAWVHGRDELHQLAGSFNHMVEQQKELVDSLQRNQLELQTIIASISEGLLVLDLDGRITLANESFQNMCRQRDWQGRLYWEVFRDSRFNELVRRSLETKKDTQGELDVNDRMVSARISYLPAAARLIATFHDISEFKKLEKVKRDFISNLSHELRTPLTAIKGFVETLEEESPVANRNYLEIIRRHTDRLVAIVSDLMTLSELEEPNLQRENEEVDLRSLAENVRKIYAAKAKEKNIRLQVKAENDLPPFVGDPFKLEQLFINLVDNALKFTDRGQINVSLAQKERQIEIRVSDTGVGIPAEHLPRIFERFYVVDKSRSRQLGGTGLGLAIVKHTVLLHDGQIQAHSQPGQGTEFIITLPLQPSA